MEQVIITVSQRSRFKKKKKKNYIWETAAYKNNLNITNKLLKHLLNEGLNTQLFRYICIKFLEELKNDNIQ